MIKGFYTNSKNWGLAILKDQNSPLQCSVIERDTFHNTITITHLTESELSYEQALIGKGV